MIKKLDSRFDADFISGAMSLRIPQTKSLKILENLTMDYDILNKDNNEKLIKAINQQYPTFTDFERNFTSITFALATGVGKTRLMGAFIAYLYSNYGIKHFLVVAPSTTIYDKLKSDLGYPENFKYVFKGLNCFKQMPRVISDDDYLNRNISIYDSDVSIYVYNIGKFDKENTKMKAFNENLGMSFYEKLSAMDDLVVIMDESHHYRAARGMDAINNLKPILGIELTATPLVNVKNKQIPFKNVVFEYPLSEAIKDGYTRVPFAVTRTDFNFYKFGDEALDKLMLNDGIMCHKMIKEKLRCYAKNTQQRLVKPFMLVVCKDTEHAKKIEDYIKSDNFENGFYKYKTITINSKQKGAESEYNTKQLLEVERADNQIEIVIHVNMLKEGWDVNNLYTIVPLRTATSKILREQMVGRGLRLPYGKRTGNKEIDSVMLTAHDKFNEIIEEAQKGNSIFNAGNVIKIEDFEQQKEVYTQLSMNYSDVDDLIEELDLKNEIESHDFATKVSELLIKNVEDYIFNNTADSNLEKDGKAVISQNVRTEIRENVDLGEIYEANKEPIEHWLKENLSKTYDEMLEKFIMIPKIRIEREAGEYFFEDFDLDLSAFNQKPTNSEMLIRNLIDASDQEILDGGYINFDAINPNKTLVDEIRKKPEINYEENSELLFKLINSLTIYFSDKYGAEAMKNIVMMYKLELVNEIYSQMLKHFVRNEGIIKEEVFTDRKINIQSNYTYSIIKNIFDIYDSEQDGKITSILFNGIKKGVFSSAKFDSVPELMFARILERDTNCIKTWLRPSPNEFNITYANGKRYEPDFVVETFSSIFMIEVKADKDLFSSDVLAKKARAMSYCKLVSNWTGCNGMKRWNYVLIPTSKITENSTFQNLCNQFKCE